MSNRRAQASEPAASGWAHTSLARTCEALRARRQQLGMSQEAVAGRIGVDYRLFQRWEYGQRAPSLFLLAAWCQALGCSLVVAVPSPPCLADRPPGRRGGSKTAGTSHPGFVPEISRERLAG